MFQEKQNMCGECGTPATWICHTQFAGNHPFCTEHAQKEKDFGLDSDNSNFWWEELSTGRVAVLAPKHPTEVEGYDGLIEDLVADVHRMRYDVVAEFYGLCAADLRRQAEGDMGRARPQLAVLLGEAAAAAEEQQQLFERIYNLCKPHMDIE